MGIQKFLKSKQFKILVGFAIVLGIIIITRAGYDLGQWFHQAIN